MGVRTASSANGSLDVHLGGRPPARCELEDADASPSFREAFAVCMARIDEVREAHGLLRRRGRLITAWAALHAAREHVEGRHHHRQNELLDRLVSVLEGIDASFRAETRDEWLGEEPATRVTPTRLHGERRGRGGQGSTQ